MGRQRRNSKVLEGANQRINGLSQIEPDVDFGGDLTLSKFKQKAAKFSADLDTYNQQLAQLDDLANSLNADEKSLGELSERMLAGAGARWGKDSSQYELAGGTRKSERRRRASGKTTGKPAA